MRWRPLPVLLVVLGCNTPCKDLNAYLVEVYDGCALPLPEDLEDGGKGACPASWEETECTKACYDEVPCGALDGSDPVANEDWNTCLQAC
jgi:hypothetical protein